MPFGIPAFFIGTPDLILNITAPCIIIMRQAAGKNSGPL